MNEIPESMWAFHKAPEWQGIPRKDIKTVWLKDALAQSINPCGEIPIVGWGEYSSWDPYDAPIPSVSSYSTLFELDEADILSKNERVKAVEDLKVEWQPELPNYEPAVGMSLVLCRPESIGWESGSDYITKDGKLRLAEEIKVARIDDFSGVDTGVRLQYRIGDKWQESIYWVHPNHFMPI